MPAIKGMEWRGTFLSSALLLPSSSKTTPCKGRALGNSKPTPHRASFTVYGIPGKIMQKCDERPHASKSVKKRVSGSENARLCFLLCVHITVWSLVQRSFQNQCWMNPHFPPQLACTSHRHSGAWKTKQWVSLLRPLYVFLEV